MPPRTERIGPPDTGEQEGLVLEWRRLGRAATIVALLTSPATFAIFYVANDLPLWLSLILTLLFVAAFRGLVDVICHKLIPRPSMYNADEELAREDVTYRRRRWYWRTKFKRLTWLIVIVVGLTTVVNLIMRLFGLSPALWDTWSELLDQLQGAGPAFLIQMFMLMLQLPLLFVANFLIFFGPLLAFGVMQMKAFEPGDADWGVKLDDVRGQAEPKEDVKRVITLWAAGDEFRKAGGKPERGLLLIGAPGTGKTMLSKAIATSFNSPIMTMPGSGFAQTFIGLDVVMVMILIARARRLARKWGGTCMIFIDEIDAVGRRRTGLGGMFGMTGYTSQNLEDHLFFGPWGSLTSSGDLVLETRAWRERVFQMRQEGPKGTVPGSMQAVAERIQNFMFPGMGGGMALNQLLVQMDGMDSPPVLRKWATKKFNTFLDAMYIVPRRVGPIPLRRKPPRPRGEQVYFIGATNVDINQLDPALIRPGRMGRHIWFRTPTAEDRRDIFDLYINKVAHDPDLDRPQRRDEMARVTGGYSPAMIEQVCSMALTFAHADGRPVFEWSDLIEAMTTIESGTAVGVNYVEEETRAVAIHEAGHAVASHVYMQDVLSTRLSIRMRGGSLGHHQAIEKEERFSSWRHEDVGRLVWTLGAMAAEHVFYGENSRGVGGDVGSATSLAALMVGMWGMGPEPVDLSHLEFDSDDERRDREKEIAERFERIGMRIMNRASGGGPMQGDPIGSVLGDPGKKRAAAQILGQTYLTAVCLIRHNREQVARIAETLIERKEMHGDEVVELLDAAQLKAPVIDITDETIWPRL